MRSILIGVFIIVGSSTLACRSLHSSDSDIRNAKGPTSTPAGLDPRAYYIEDHPDRNLAYLKSYTVGIGHTDAGKPFCSGLLVSYGSEKYILTAAHCLKDAVQNSLGIYPYFEKQESPDRQKLSFPVVGAAFVDSRIDLGLAVADLPPSVPAMPWLIGEAKATTPIFGAGHPAGDFKTLSDQCEVLSIGSPFLFTHDCKMISGSSGSAIISKTSRQILGVMSAGEVTLDIQKDGTSKLAVNIFPLASLIEKFLQDGQAPLGYNLDTIDPGYHFLVFKGQAHCGRKLNESCGPQLQSVVKILEKPKYLEILKSKFPAELKQFNGYADSDFGFLIRLRNSGEHKVDKNMIDYVYTSGDDFSDLMDQWLELE